jgi:hypothetical protein
MISPLRTCLYIATAGSIAITSHFELSASGPPAAPSLAAANPSPLVSVEDEVHQFQRDVHLRGVALLSAGDFRGLDAMARDFRSSQASFANGGWKLNCFYQELSGVGDKASEKLWEMRLALLRRWFEADTESITARVAMAHGLVDYAWHARGGGWASDVKSDAWPLVYERIAEAGRILDAARDLPEKCPGWYCAWMTKAMLAGDDRQRYDEVFAEGVHNFPTCSSLYVLKVSYLQERWYGKPGEWQAFAKQSADSLGGENGDVLYAQILWYIHNRRTYGDPVGETGIEWPRARRGFEALQRRYPDSLMLISEFCSISGHVPGEAALMRSLFDKIGNRVILSVWREPDRFAKDRSFAYSH